LLILGAAALLAMPALEVKAQFYPYGAGWGGGGFGGWGGGGDTIQGSIARGMGAFAAGAGQYNLETAQANSINANTLASINQYMYLSSLEAGKIERMRYAKRKALTDQNQQAIAQIAEQIRTNPTQRDIDDGAALNALLDQLSHPSILDGSALRLANAKIDAKLIRKVPFRDNTDAVTIALDQLTDEKAWPLPLRGHDFDVERKAYIKAVDDALAQDREGDLTSDTIGKVRGAVAALSKRVGEVIPASRQPDHLQATSYIKGLAGFSKMLERANVEAILADLSKVEDTTAGHLLAFMHTYNLRFGPSSTPEQRMAYGQLYGALKSTRDKLLGRPGEEPIARGSGDPNAVPPGQIFQGIEEKHLHSTPAPPPPGGPQ
jgi:hypothetical protein